MWYAADSAHVLSQLVSIDYSDSTPDIAFTYDRLGRQLTVPDVLGTRTNVYDALNLLEERYPDGDALVRTYDAYGRAAGIALGSDYAVGYGYDAFGRFSTVAVSNGATFTYSYVPNSSLLSGYTNDLGLSVSYEYEPFRDHKTLVSNAWGTNTISTFAYDYDAVGHRTQRVDSGLTTNVFAYNTRSELINAVMGTNTYAYAYDPIGNRTSSSENGVTNLYAANELNQYTALNPASTNPTPFTYDPDGNMTSDGIWSYTWDAENRLIGVTSNGTFLVTDRYDFMSRRIEKGSAGGTNVFLYDGWNLIRETIAGISSLSTNRYTWGLDLSQSLQGASGIGGLLQAFCGGTNTINFYDANGNTTAITDDYGNIIGVCSYSPFGNEIVMRPLDSEGLPFQFSTKYHGSGEDLLYYGYRYYSAAKGRWIARDPLSEQGGANTYCFVGNMPIGGIDYLGLLDPAEFDNWPLEKKINWFPTSKQSMVKTFVRQPRNIAFLESC